MTFANNVSQSGYKTALDASVLSGASLPDETPEACAARELWEESGLHISIERLSQCPIIHVRGFRIFLVFVSPADVAEQQMKNSVIVVQPQLAPLRSLIIPRLESSPIAARPRNNSMQPMMVTPIRVCRYFRTFGSCRNGNRCKFAHM